MIPSASTAPCAPRPPHCGQAVLWQGLATLGLSQLALTPLHQPYHCSSLESPVDLCQQEHTHSTVCPDCFTDRLTN